MTLVGSLVAGLVGRWTKQSHVRAPPNMTHHLHHQHEATTADDNTTNANRTKSRKKVMPNQLGRYKHPIQKEAIRAPSKEKLIDFPLTPMPQPPEFYSLCMGEGGCARKRENNSSFRNTTARNLET